MQLKTKPKGSVNRVGVIEATDGRRLKYRTIWRENGKQCSKGFETLEEAIDFRRYIENEMINEYKTYLEEENNMSEEEMFKKLEKAMEGKSSYKDIIIENQQKKINKQKEVLDKIKEYAQELRFFDNESVEFEISNKILELLEEIE